MANVTRIKAKDEGRSKETDESDDSGVTRKLTVKANGGASKKERAKKAAEAKKAKKAEKAEKKAAKRKDEKEIKQIFILFRPFVAIGRYIRDSWREVRQVRWPDRKTTWKMTISVIVYVLLIAAVIMLLDAFFAFIFNQLLSKV